MTNLNRFKGRSESAFTLVELMACVVAIALLSTVMVSAAVAWNSRGDRVACFNNQRQIANAFIQFSLEHEDTPPWRVPGTEGGTWDQPERDMLWFEYWWLRDSLKTPAILYDPADTRPNGRIASTWDLTPGVGLRSSLIKNRGVSYPLGYNSYSLVPRSILVTDRNLAGLGSTFVSRSGFVVRLNPTQARWFNDVHGLVGNVAFADGSVDAINTLELREVIRNWKNNSSRDPQIMIATPW
jgi:prepilin-type processing-associated H-X9-DG protein